MGGILGGMIPFAGWAFAGKDAFQASRELLQQERTQRSVLEESPGQSAQRYREDLVDLVFKDFEAILNPTDNTAQTVPVVLLVDDAQWLDPDTVRLLHRLLLRAETRGWPLLIVATHREEEWHQPPPRDESQPPAALAHLPQSLRRPERWDGARLLRPIAQLEAVARQALPGATPAQLRLLCEKAGGNPELLQEIIDELLAEPRYFKDGDPQAELGGRAVAMVEGTTFTLQGQYRKRFRRLGRQVQRVLGWSSEQGMRFLSQITQAAAEQIDADCSADDIRDRLRRAERPGCCVQLFEQDGRWNLGEFRQRVFQELAADHLGFDPQERETVRRAVQSVLRGWIDTAAIDQLPEAERLDALLIARRTLRPAGPDAPEAEWKTWGAALVRLVRLYSSDCLWPQAAQAARQFAEARPHGWPSELVPTWDQLAVADLLCEQRDYARARRLLKPLCAELTSLKERTEPDSSLWHDVGALIQRLGDVAVAVGDLPEAATLFASLEQRSRELAEQFGATPEALRDVSVSLDRVGDVDRADGRLADARGRYEESLRVRREIIEQFGATPEALRDVSVSLDRVGDVDRADVRLADARTRYEESLRVAREIIEQFGATPEAAAGRQRFA